MMKDKDLERLYAFRRTPSFFITDALRDELVGIAKQAVEGWINAEAALVEQMDLHEEDLAEYREAANGNWRELVELRSTRADYRNAVRVRIAHNDTVTGKPAQDEDKILLATFDVLDSLNAKKEGDNV